VILTLKKGHYIFLLVIGFVSWLVPGGGYFILNEKKRAVIIFLAISLLFLLGIYAGSIGVVEPISSWPWYLAQVLNSPAVFILGNYTSGGGYPVYGRSQEIGQLYTSISGLLNLLCIVNAVHLAHTHKLRAAGD
jgi:hypothetical protein